MIVMIVVFDVSLCSALMYAFFLEPNGCQMYRGFALL